MNKTQGFVVKANFCRALRLSAFIVATLTVLKSGLVGIIKETSEGMNVLYVHGYHFTGRH